ncbi:hypothetical protein F4821DRAFT_103462 [Hypoxylon rubiginosum]|uniref:Uncharacterized protein n=1 Tax=Hypoxylon rubiginosum TaxID=110542 RepID=A0ACC0D4X0_9PEZI|nr:hypothetical protein F4821DRAFT_103462 [Hypoxylon rubiginosum]
MGLSKVALIAAPTKEPRPVVHASSGIAAILAPTLVAVLQFHQLFGAASLFLGIRVSWLAWQIFCAGRIFTYQLSLALELSVRAGKAIWNTKTVRRLRKKFVFELYTLLLGSGGNNLFLVLFWPGWWVLGFVVLVARLCIC